MQIGNIVALERDENARRARKQGFIPAVIYGKGHEAERVKFDKANLFKVLRQYGERAKVKIVVNEKNKIAIMKDVHKDPISNEIQHMDFQLVEDGDTVKWDIPIMFSGREALEAKRLYLQVDQEQIEVVGKVEDIPDAIRIDVSNKELDDLITIADLGLDSKIKSIKPDTSVIGIVKE